LLKQEKIITQTNSEVRADIPIPIGGIIIAIEGERARNRAIIRITADMQHVPPVVEHLMTFPFITFIP
jgi:hypothetical protein